MKNVCSLLPAGMLLFPLGLLVAGATIGCSGDGGGATAADDNGLAQPGGPENGSPALDGGTPTDVGSATDGGGGDATSPAAANEIMGYATMNGGTTGGAGGPTVTVTSCGQLRTAAQGDTPKIIKVSGTVTGNDELVSVGSNTSIIGLPGAVLRACGLYMFGTHNVIIQNLKMIDGSPTAANGVGYSTWSAKEGAHHVWVDHVEMRPSPGVKDNGHTMANVSNAADFVTVSWSSMYDKYTGLLIGASPQAVADKGHLTVTIHHCLFENMLERQPKVRFGTVHAFNNYFRNAMTDGHTPFGITVTMGGTVRTDANYFENFKGFPISTRYDQANETDGFISGLETNYKDAVGSFQITTPASSWLPPYSYAAYLTPVMDVPATVLKGVGATL